MSYINVTTLNNSVENFVLDRVTDCGDLTNDVNMKVSSTSRVLIIMIGLMTIFKWWAITKIMNSNESHEKKKFLVDFCQTMINSLIILFVFYLLYWIYLARLDF